MYGIKRRLTQSEKQKYYVEGGGQQLGNFSLKKSSSLQFLECPQNLVHSRKFTDKCCEIDKAKSKSIARINGEKHLLKLKYKGLIKDEEDDDITRTFFLQPGFRFHANGDIRKLRDPRVVPSVEALSKKSSLSLVNSTVSDQSLQSKRHGRNIRKTTSDSSNISSNTGQSGHGDGPTNPKEDKNKEIDIKKAIKEIENDLAKMKTDKDLIDINKRIEDVRHSLTFIRAHANDIKAPIHHITVNVDDQEKFLRQLRDHGVDKKCDIQQKLSRHCFRLNCMACEFRLKCSSDSLPVVRASSKEHLKRWEYAPRGSYVSNLEDKESTSKSLLNIKRSKSKSAKLILHKKQSCDKRENTTEKRPTKSATTTSERKVINSNDSQRKRRPHGLVDKFKNRELDQNSRHATTESKGEYSGYTGRNKSLQDFESERILEVHDINTSYSRVDEYDGEDIQSEPGRRKESVIDIITREVSKEKERTMEKVNEFYDKIPDPHPSITTWRNSSGHLLTWKPKDKAHGSKSPRSSNMTWAQYHRYGPHLSLEHSLHSKFYLSSQEKLTGDPNSIEELKKCRYLREFKMRKNLIV